MGYVMVSADFPGVTATQRQQIYECLEKNHWTKVTDFGRDISTVWYASYSTAGDVAIKAAINRFKECSSLYCEPKLVAHYGPDKPKKHGLD